MTARLLATAAAIAMGIGVAAAPHAQPRASQRVRADRIVRSGSRERLIDTLAVLRAPQTQADRGQELLRHLRSLIPSLQDPGPERLDASLVRIAGVTPWGFRIVLAGFITIGHGRPSRIPEMLGALVGGEIGPRAPAAEIGHRGEVAHFQIAPRRIRVVIVVPDGVAELAYSAPGIHTVTVRVHDNVAAFVIYPRPKAPGLVEVNARMVWFGSRGEIIRRVPSLLSLKRR